MTSSDTVDSTESTRSGAVSVQPSAARCARVQSRATFTPLLTGSERAHPTALTEESSAMFSSFVRPAGVPHDVCPGSVGRSTRTGTHREPPVSAGGVPRFVRARV
ncbi:hypothetical protein [Streptomyces canarius]